MTFSDIHLARRLEGAEAMGGTRFVEARRRLQPESGAEWIEVAGARAMFDGLDSPITQTFGLGLSGETSDADLDRIEAFFRQRGAPVDHEVSPLAGVTLLRKLAGRGYRPIELTSVMYQPVRGRETSRDPRLTVRLMREDEIDLWSDVSARGWSETPELAEFLRGLGRVLAATEGSLGFFAEWEGEPIATGLLRVEAGVAYFGGASTVPGARRRGAQGALLDARMNEGAARGCDLAAMGAEPGSASQRNAQRQGFAIAYTRTKWRLA